MPEDLGQPHVPDPRHHTLIEEDVPEQATFVDRPNSSDQAIHGRLVGEQVGAEARGTPVVDREHGAVPLRGLPALGRQDEPWPSSRRAAVSCANAPATVHAQVAADDDASLEVEQEVLPHGVHGLQHATVHGARDVRRQPAGAR